MPGTYARGIIDDFTCLPEILKLVQKMSEYLIFRRNVMNKHYQEVGKLGKRGTFTIPAALRKRFGMTNDSLVIAEEREDGILLRPAMATPVEIYSDRRTAEFLLSNTVDAADYTAARQDVEALGLDPDQIPHQKPV
jgi:AbrB family looped-hinge helix DNA binding protein